MDKKIGDWQKKIEQQIHEIESKVFECPIESDVNAIEEKIKKINQFFTGQTD